MAESSNNLSLLYRTARQEFGDAGSFSDFKTKLQNPESRQKLYDAFRSAGYKDLGDFGSFETKIKSSLTFGPPAPSTEVLQTGIEAAKPEPTFGQKAKEAIQTVFDPMLAARDKFAQIKHGKPFEQLAPTQKIDVITDSLIEPVVRRVQDITGQQLTSQEKEIAAISPEPLVKPSELISSPSKEDLEKNITAKLQSFAKGTLQAGEGLLSRENIALAKGMTGLFKQAPAVVAKAAHTVLGGYFTTILVKHFPEYIEEYKNAPEDKKIEVLGNIVGTGALALLGAVGTVKGAKETLRQVVEDSFAKSGFKPVTKEEIAATLAKPVAPDIDAEAIRKRREEMAAQDAAAQVGRSAVIEAQGNAEILSEHQRLAQEGQTRGEQIRQQAKTTEERQKQGEFATQKALQEDLRANGVQVGDLKVEVTPKAIYESITGNEFDAGVRTDFITWRKEKGSPYLLGDLEMYAREKAARPAEAPITEPVQSIEQAPIPEQPRPLTIKERQAQLKAERLKLQEERLAEQRRTFEEKKAKVVKPKEPVATVEKPEPAIPPAQEAKTAERPPAEVEKQAEPVAILKEAPLQETGSALPIPELDKLDVTADGVAKPKIQSVADFQKQYGERPSAQYERATKDVETILPSMEAIDVPTTEQLGTIKSALKAKGYSDRVIDEIVEPSRFRRPSEPTPSEATSRAGRVRRAIEPETPELKKSADEIATTARKHQDAKSVFEEGRQEILADLKKLGVDVYFDAKTDRYVVFVKPGRESLSPEAAEAIKLFKQDAAEGGGYSPKTIGRGFNIVATPSIEGISRPLPKSSLKERIANLILRRRLRDKAEAEFNNAKKRYKDDLVDRYLTSEEPTNIIGKAADGSDVVIETRRALSAIDPDIEPFASQIKALRAKAVKVQGEPYAELRGGISEKTLERVKEEGGTFFTKNLTGKELIEFEGVLDRMSERYVKNLKETGLPARLDLGLLEKGLYRDMVEIGYYTSKALVRATGKKAVEFGEWSAQMLKELGDRVRPFLNEIWDTIQKGYVGGEIKVPDSVKSQLAPREVIINKAQVQTKSGQPYGINALLSPSPEGIIAGAKLTSTLINIVKKTAYKYAVQPIIKTVEQGSLQGKQVASGFRSAIDRWERNENRNFSEKILPVAKVIGRRPRLAKHLDKVSIDANGVGRSQLVEWLKKGEIPKDAQVNPIERKAFEAAISLGKERRELSNRLKKVDSAQEELFGFGDYNKDLFIKVPTPELLEAIKLGHGQIYDRTVSILEKLNPTLTREQVRYNLANFRFNKFDDFPTHIEQQGSLYPILASDALSYLQGLNRDVSRLKGIVETFGTNYKKSLKEIRETVPVDKQGDFDNMVDSYFGIRPEPKDPSGMGKRWARGLLEPVVKNAMLANAAIMQPTQILSAQHLVGAKNLYSSLVGFISHPLRTRAELEAVAAYNRGFLDLTLRHGRWPEDIGKALTELSGKATLLEPLIKLTDLAISNAFKTFADGIKNRGGKLTTSEKQTLQSLDFTDGQINVIDKGGLSRSEELYSAIIRRGRKATTFTELKGPEKSKFQHSQLGQILLPFQNFSIGQMQSLQRITSNLTNAFKTGQGKAAAINKMATFLGGTALIGETSLFLRAYMTDKDTKEALVRGDEDVVKRLGRDFMEAGLYPYRLIDYSLQRANNGYEFISGLFAPVSVVADGLDAFVYKRGRYKDRTDLEAAGMFLERYATKPVTDSTIPRAIKALATTIGLADDNPKIEIALRRAYKWKGNKGFDAPEGDEFAVEMRRQLRGVVEELKKADVGEVPFNDKIRESLVKALQAKAMSKTMGEKIGDPEEAANRVAKSLRGKRVLEGLDSKEIDELADAIGGQEMLDQIIWYDRLLESLAESVKP